MSGSKRGGKSIEFEELGGESPDMPVAVNDDNIDTFVQRFPLAVVDCWAPWCGPCHMISPVIESLAADYKGKIAFGKLNTDENERTAMRFGIMSIPTLLVFKNGKLVDQIVGAMPRNMLEPMITKYL